MEDEVELAHVFEAPVQSFHKHLEARRGIVTGGVVISHLVGLRTKNEYVIFTYSAYQQKQARSF